MYFGRVIKTSIVVALTAAITAASFSPARVSAVNLKSITSASIREKEGQINAAQSEKNQLQSSLSDVKKMKADLENAKKNLQNYVVELDGNLEEIQQKIADLKEQILEKEEEIRQTKEELEEAIQIENDQYAAMKKRVKFMYETGNDDYVSMILGSASFAEMLNKVEYIQKLSDYDDNKLQEFVTTREYVELCKAQLETEEELLEEAKKGVESEEAALEELISEKTREITAYQSDINSKSAAIAEYEAQIAAQNELIRNLEAAVAAERERIARANGMLRKYDGGMFAFPAPSYTRISDDYGNRIHPTLKVQQFHNGVDLAAPSGSPILAAYDGEVVAADYSSTMGNYIMIDHGDSLYTIYMHASALYVSKGAVVSKGQKIAAVGSTGRSTGPHLHFSVRVNGNYTSPWNYLR